jgi:hypothetical protein
MRRAVNDERSASRRTLRVLLFMTCCALSAAPASAQVSALVSPGRLNRAHAGLEGLDSCLSCHTAGRRVEAEKCLGCHRPVAERIAKKTGVHRRVTTDCVGCLVEHAGVDAELRPFDQRSFNHAAETGFALDGLHVPLQANCAACHKTRSFLTAKPACDSCHTDVHKGALGSTCTSCHSTSLRFTQTRTSFDHRRTKFPLTGSHAKVACASCHPNNAWAGVRFGSCTNCHTDVHKQRFGAACSGCHTTAGWATTKVDHTLTAFPLKGRHEAVACVGCHANAAMKVAPASKTCGACHADLHQGQFKQDCAACHTEAGFKGGTFDHSTTVFPLVDAHAKLSCAQCHTTRLAARADPVPRTVTAPPASGSRPAARPGASPPQSTGLVRAPAVAVADYRGLSRACGSCHVDVHRAELGTTCETCHSARTFRVTAFTHRAQRAFFAGQHASATCEQCHQPPPAAARATSAGSVLRVGFTTTSTACASCHRDVHLGQVSAQCETCHSIATPKFGVTGFTHAATKFPLTGKHAQAACQGCHKTETGAFPTGHGEALRLTGIGTDCTACHPDVHGGELPQRCDQCHSTQSFTVQKYTHRNAGALRAFFAGKHRAATCEACHKPERRVFGVARLLPSYRTTTTCTGCHSDVHRGALGPKCESCHRL